MNMFGVLEKWVKDYLDDERDKKGHLLINEHIYCLRYTFNENVF